jgi:hypothetical protein
MIRVAMQEPTTTKVDQDYKEVNATYNFGPAQGFVSYGELANDTKTTTVALSKELSRCWFYTFLH